MTSDQVDNLLEELNELVAHPSVRTENIEPVVIQHMPATFGLDYLNEEDVVLYFYIYPIVKH